MPLPSSRQGILLRLGIVLGLLVLAVVGACALPLTCYVIVVRGVLIKGGGFECPWQQIIPVAALTFAAFSIAVR